MINVERKVLFQPRPGSFTYLRPPLQMQSGGAKHSPPLHKKYYTLYQSLCSRRHLIYEPSENNKREKSNEISFESNRNKIVPVSPSAQFTFHTGTPTPCNVLSRRRSRSEQIYIKNQLKITKTQKKHSSLNINLNGY